MRKITNIHDNSPDPKNDKNKSNSRWDESLSDKFVENIPDRNLHEIIEEIQLLSLSPDSIESITQ